MPRGGVPPGATPASGESSLAYQVLARRWRPRSFADVVGQEHVTRTLSNAIKTGRLAHGFLFCGPRGVGKTSTARILAKCLNCERGGDGPTVEPCHECASGREVADGVNLDVLEIDGASNRGIDEIRDLRENVRYAPSGGRAKVYIIDEVHMLTKEAFNALLKTLEEPPPGVYFVFATTEAHKVPATIRSRCQQYDFHRIPAEVIAVTLRDLAKKEKFDIEEAAVEELARQADGGLRDAQSLLDQAAAVGEGVVTLDTIKLLLGDAAEEAALGIVEAVAAGDAGAALVRLQELLERGLDPSRVAISLTRTLRDLLVVRSVPAEAARLGVRTDLVESYRDLAGRLTESKATGLLALASRTITDLRRSARPRLALAVALARMARLEAPAEMAGRCARVGIRVHVRPRVRARLRDSGLHPRAPRRDRRAASVAGGIPPRDPPVRSRHGGAARAVAARDAASPLGTAARRRGPGRPGARRRSPGSRDGKRRWPSRGDPPSLGGSPRAGPQSQADARLVPGARSPHRPRWRGAERRVRQRLLRGNGEPAREPRAHSRGARGGRGPPAHVPGPRGRASAGSARRGPDRPDREEGAREVPGHPRRQSRPQPGDPRPGGKTAARRRSLRGRESMNINKMMKQVQKAQQQMQQVQEELAGKTVEATAGGGMVKVVMTGDGALRSIALDPEVVDPEDVDMLQDLIVAAVNEGRKRTAELASSEMQKAAGGLGLPPGMI